MGKHLVIIFNSLDIGGIERKIVDIANFYQSKISVTIILRHRQGALIPDIHPNVKIITSSLCPPFLTYILLKIRPSLILTFGNYCGICTVLSSPFSKIIISEDSSIDQQIELDTYPQIRKMLVKLTYPLATKIITLTTTGQKKLLQIVPSASVAILPNWLPLIFKPSAHMAKTTDILFLGRFAPQKNPLLFLKFCRKLPTFKITMIGSGILESKIKKYIKKYNLNIRLLPATTNPTSYYQQSKILLITSVHEGFPLTILESLAHHCLPIVNQIPEIQEFFDYQPHHLIYSLSPTKNIRYLLTHPALLNKMIKYYHHRVISQQSSSFSLTTNFINQFL